MVFTFSVHQQAGVSFPLRTLSWVPYIRPPSSIRIVSVKNHFALPSAITRHSVSHVASDGITPTDHDEDAWQQEMLEDATEEGLSRPRPRSTVFSPTHTATGVADEVGFEWAVKARERAFKAAEERAGSRGAKAAVLGGGPVKKKKTVKKKQKAASHTGLIRDSSINSRGSSSANSRGERRQASVLFSSESEPPAITPGNIAGIAWLGGEGREVGDSRGFEEGTREAMAAALAISGELARASGFRNGLGDLQMSRSLWGKTGEGERRISMQDWDADVAHEESDTVMIPRTIQQSEGASNSGRAKIGESSVKDRVGWCDSGGGWEVQDGWGAEADDEDEYKKYGKLQEVPAGRGVEVADVEMRMGRSRGVRERAYVLNRRVVEAGSLEELLEVLGGELEVGGLDVTQLTPVNASTALHRLATHAEKERLGARERHAVASKRQVAALVEAAEQLLPECSARSLANVMWALSKLESGVGGRQGLFAREMSCAVTNLEAKVGDLTPQQLANVVSALGRARHSATDLMAKIDTAAAKVLAEGQKSVQFRAQEVSQLIWGFAVLNQPMTASFDALDGLEEGGGGVPWGSFSERQLANTAWGYTVREGMGRPSFAALLAVIGQRGEWEEEGVMGHRHLSQLHQVALSLDLIQGSPAGTHLEIPEGLRARALATWQAEVGRTRRASGMECQLAQALEGGGLTWRQEYTAGSYSVDFALPERQLAVEADGPSHFCRVTDKPMGPTVLKRRHLEAAGWTVVSVPHMQWETLHTNFERKQYMSRVLKPYLM